MRRIACVISVFLLAFVLVATTGQAQTLTGTIQGKVTDQQGGVLPGVTATLIGPRGSQSTTTDGQGDYRFFGVAPATYVVKVEIAGFLAQQKESVIVSMGKTVLVDFALKVGGLTESVEVVGIASTVDTKSSATETNLSNELLTAMPIYSSTATGLLNSAPGISGNSAYGGTASYGNALLLDGVDTRDPEGGSAWTFFNQNLIEEIQIGGLGAPAEYGGFSGGVVNTITKSGGNLFSGLFSVRYTKGSLASKNISDAVLKANPALGKSDITKKLMDYTVQAGGPIKKDKAFFFGSIQRYSAVYDPIGPRTTSTDVSPRFNFKVTLQPTPADTLLLGTQYDQYNVTGRVGWWSSTQATDSATVTEDAPEWIWNVQWRRVFGSTALLETKFTGYTGYYYLDPIDPRPPTYDADTNEYGGGGGGLYYADRSRNQANVSLTKYAEGFGHHSLKFGAEIERSHVRSQYQPYGPQGFYVLSYSGVPAYRVSYGYDVQGDNHRVSAFAQDQWSVGRFTMNLGVRLDRIRGYSPMLKKDVYTPDNAWGPRLGLAYDLTGKGTSVLKGFWGRYFEGTASGFYTQATPGIQDYTGTPINSNGSLGTPEVWTPAVIYRISSSIKHPEVNEFNVAWEQQFTKDTRFTATFIRRDTTNFINNVINGARWTPITLTNALTKQPYTAYKWANRSATSDDFLIRNVEGYQYIANDGSVIGTADPTRKYKGLMLVLSRSMKARWGYQVSYVLSKSEGNGDNTGWGSWLQGTPWDSPNTAIINNYGELGMSRRHEIKAYITAQIPRAEVMLSTIFTGMSGRPYTPYTQPSGSALNLPSSPSSRRQIFLEPRGTEKNDFYKNIDLRAEKYFTLQGHRFGVYADIMNLFNIATITARQTRYPDTTIGGNTVNYQAPTGVQGARQVTFGGRWSF